LIGTSNGIKDKVMKLSKKPTEIAALLQAYVAENDDKSAEAADILALAAELLVYNDIARPDNKSSVRV
tara:strand:- start:110 stop:313 length:204 start_codon:yes stop_codon:yes gene_type:complete